MFSSGNGRDPPYREDAIVHRLGTHWETMHLRNKLYAAVGTSHGMIEVLENMQAAYPDRFARDRLGEIANIHAAQSHAGFHHDGWRPDVRPMEVTGSQLCAAYVMATQLVDRQVLLEQFSHDRLNRDEVWDLVHRTTCSHDPYFDPAERLSGARVTVAFEDGLVLEESLDMPRGFDPWVTNEQLVEKYRKLGATVVDSKRLKAIEEAVLGLDALEDVTELIELLAMRVGKSLK